ncbi:CRISPR-associated helicase Cas3' [Xanthobacter sediminis]|uniref:CRISPR-associated helicase Cas3' n=1 Tax=Xanthobacter sediminis TaxID=3119926 RepID=UPI0037285AE9
MTIKPTLSAFYAHSTERNDLADWEPLLAHLETVARLAAEHGGKFGGSAAAHLAGLLHDLGKFSPLFQAYIRGEGSSVDHSTAGGRTIMRAAEAAPLIDKIVAELLAYGICGHHAGLPDKQGAGDSTLERRLNSASVTIPALADAWRDLPMPPLHSLLPANFKLDLKDKDALAFRLATLGRMLFSCLVDADFIGTERFYESVGGPAKERDWQPLGAHIDTLIAAFDAHMEAMRAAVPEERRAEPLYQLRQEVLAHVRERAALPRGVFTLDVPTGGGKTLASLAFALEHAKQHGMDRIIYAIPFTSIIEQTADVFRGVLGDELILEHHSALEPEEGAAVYNDQRLDAKRRLAMENWAAPIVVTTNVQLFESLFSHRTSRCRKLHNIANAVIILDEAQVIPLNVLRPCVAMLDELARNYGCSIVLCTATQPALLDDRFKGGFCSKTTQALAPDPERLDAAFRRVTPEVRPGKLDDPALVEEMRGHPQGLVIVNSRRHALNLYRAAQAAELPGLVHLSTRQTAADRRQILAEVRRRLIGGEACRVISTSLIEAGVDVSFPRAWRAMAGLDSIIQAAGRVNREWRWSREESRIIVFTPSDAKPPSEIARFAQAMERVAKKHDDLFCKTAIEDYFKEVYWQTGDGLDRISVPNADGQKVGKSALSLFGLSGGSTAFAYRTVGENFRLIEDGMAPVIITRAPEARSTLDALRAGAMPAGAAARRLQGHVVGVPPRDRDTLIRNGHVAYVEGFADQFAVLRTDSLYSPETGLAWERADELGGDFIL